MSTKPRAGHASIASDARHIFDAATADQKNAQFKKRIGERELREYLANIESLESGTGTTSALLHAQVAAGVHSARTGATLAAALADVRDDAKLTLRGDKELQAAFGVGARIDASSASVLRSLATTVIAAAGKNATEATKIGLDKQGVKHLGELVTALDGAELAHVHVRTDRHTEATHTDSLAHVVAAETAHIRLAARRVFRGNETALARYASIAPRHTVKPRAKSAKAVTAS